MAMTPPNRHKMALLTWFIVYPMITLLMAALEPFLDGMAMPLRTLFLTLIMVPAMVYFALPFATARRQPWLSPRPQSPVLTEEYPNAR